MAIQARLNEWKLPHMAPEPHYSPRKGTRKRDRSHWLFATFARRWTDRDAAMQRTQITEMTGRIPAFFVARRSWDRDDEGEQPCQSVSPNVDESGVSNYEFLVTKLLPFVPG